MWDLLDPIQRSYIVQRIDARGKPSVQAENLIVDEGGQGQVVEEISEEFPNACVAILS